MLLRHIRPVLLLALTIALLFPHPSHGMVPHYTYSPDSCRNDPVNNFDPLGLETFVQVDDQAREITLNLLLRYVPAKGAKFGDGELAQLAQQHEKWAEGLFGTYTYGGANAPHATAKVQQWYGMNRGERLHKEVEKDMGPKYQGYRIRLNVITTTEPEPEDALWTDPFATIAVSRGPIPANMGVLSTETSKPDVFHEYMHHLNLWDEYDPENNNRLARLRGEFEVKNWREEFHKTWQRYPEDDAVMVNAGTALYDRYIEAALFDIDNVWRKDVDVLDNVFFLEPTERFFQQAKRFSKRDLLPEVLSIIERNSR